MSTWKKASKSGQREHRERHQPESRKQFGLLEKKKDYKQRAKAFEVKKNKLKKLQKKVLNKNPDEFYFHMINSEMKDGFHYEKEKPEEHTESQLKLMQTQDIKYINYKQSTEVKKIEKLKASLHMLESEDKPSNSHTFFVDSDKKAKNFDIAAHLQTDPALLPRSYNRPTVDSLKKLEKQGITFGEYNDEIKKEKSKRYRELTKRIEREQELSVLSQKLDIKKKLLNKKDLPAKKVTEGTKTSAAIYMWKKERKR